MHLKINAPKHLLFFYLSKLHHIGDVLNTSNKFIIIIIITSSPLSGIHDWWGHYGWNVKYI